MDDPATIKIHPGARERMVRMTTEKKQAKKKALLSEKEISVFCSQLALILKSGITLYDGVQTMHEDCDSKEEEALYAVLMEVLQDGGSFSDALKKGGVFPGYMIHMTTIGERSGRLENVMESLSAFYDREDRVRQSIRAAVVYPAILVCMMVAVLTVIVVRVLPAFEKVYENLGADLSPASNSIMRFGVTASRYAVFIALGLVVVVLILALCARTNRGKELFTGASGKIPVLRRLCDKIAAGRFASALSLLLSSGYDADQALEMIPSVLPNSLVKRKVMQLQEKVAAGSSLADAIRDSDVFPKLYSKILVVGFKTGSVDEVMGKISESYEEEIDNSLNNVVAVLEPALVAVLSIIIGFILISVMMPLIGIMSSIG